MTVSVVPEPVASMMALAGLACGGFSSDGGGRGPDAQRPA